MGAAFKIQVILALLNHKLEAFALSGFNRNDQATDLILRDLGSFTLESFAGIAKAEAFFASRHIKASLVHPDGQPIDLGSWLLKKHRKAMHETYLDFTVLLAAGPLLAMRFVVVRLDPSRADQLAVKP